MRQQNHIFVNYSEKVLKYCRRTEPTQSCFMPVSTTRQLSGHFDDLPGLNPLSSIN